MNDMIKTLSNVITEMEDVIATGVKECSFAELILPSEELEDSMIEFLEGTNVRVLSLGDGSFLPINTVGMSTSRPLDDREVQAQDIADKAYKSIAEGLDGGFLSWARESVRESGRAVCRNDKMMGRGDFCNLYNILNSVEIEHKQVLINKRILDMIPGVKIESKIEELDGLHTAGYEMVVSIKHIPELENGAVYAFGDPELLGRYFVSKPKVTLSIKSSTIHWDIEVLTAIASHNKDAIAQSYVRNTKGL